MSSSQTTPELSQDAPALPAAPALLITQCLQNDFVQPLGRYEPLPNQLHVGYEEARRLLGENPEEGPVRAFMQWAYARPAEELAILHIRDWHNPDAERQQAHLSQFGPHCLRDTPGADFVFREAMDPERPDVVVDASGLNDFVDTTLEATLRPFAGQKMRVGIMGVWTEAKVTFLAYDLVARYPEFEIAVCSALCASSSRQMHFIALEQLASILGVTTFASPATFARFLAGDAKDAGAEVYADAIRRKSNRIDPGRLQLEPGDSVSEEDERLLLYLFRDAREVSLQRLDGGFSGNVVMRAAARDAFGHQQTPHVIKIGPRDAIARERTSFERVQEVLGNSAPAVVDFAELADRGAIKYRYAGMIDGGGVKTFQKMYATTDDVAHLENALDTVFLKQLGRLYEARQLERLNLLEYYDFQSKYAPGVRKRTEALVGAGNANDEELEIVPGLRAPNVCLFYERDLPDLHESSAAPRYMAYVHGDLNGANILVDGSDNVWIIDFFHTHRGHVLKDLIKLENDLLYIFTKIESEAELREAAELTHLLLDGEDLADPPDAELAQDFHNPKLQKAFRIAARLRGYYPDLIELDRDPYQLYAGVVRYAMHTLSFEESNEWQRRWALYSGCLAAARVRDSLRFKRELRVDAVPLQGEAFSASDAAAPEGRLGVTLLPGRRDRSRSLEQDLQSIQAAGYQDVLCLLTADEFERYGVPDLLAAYERAGLRVRSFPIPDQGAPPLENMAELVDWMDDRLREKKNLLVHCVGGVGRSGTVAACYLTRKRGLGAEAAIEHVRRARSRRAVENLRQEDFVRRFAAEGRRPDVDAE